MLPLMGVLAYHAFVPEKKERKIECEKQSFKSRKLAYESIRKTDDGIYLRPYKCNLCEFWHLTHKKKKTLKPHNKWPIFKKDNLNLPHKS